jgi:hypothetical protein
MVSSPLNLPSQYSSRRFPVSQRTTCARLGYSNPGNIITAEGSPADRMWVTFEAKLAASGEHAIRDGRAPHARLKLRGMLPIFGTAACSVDDPSHDAAVITSLAASYFPEMLERPT